MRIKWYTMPLLAAALAISTTVASATAIVPGGPSVVPSAIANYLTTVGPALASTGTVLVTPSPAKYTGDLIENVYLNSGGTLDFVLQYKQVSDPPPADPVAHVTAGSFNLQAFGPSAGLVTGVFYDSTNTENLLTGVTAANTHHSPTDASLNLDGTVVGFGFGNGLNRISTNQVTNLLIIRTLATAYVKTGAMSMQDSVAGSALAFQPVPEPAGILLMGGIFGVLSLFARRRFALK